MQTEATFEVKTKEETMCPRDEMKSANELYPVRTCMNHLAMIDKWNSCVDPQQNGNGIARSITIVRSFFPHQCNLMKQEKSLHYPTAR